MIGLQRLIASSPATAFMTLLCLRRITIVASSTVIHPRTSGRDAPPIHLLGVEMTSIRALPWARGYSLRGDLTRRPGQVELTRFILHWEREALETAGIYKAVFLSLFMYSVDLSFFRGFAERWNYASNTLVLEDREIPSRFGIFA